MEGPKFYQCKRCGTIISVIQNGGGPLTCCGEPMTELTANTSDGAQEKHVPVVTVTGNEVSVSVGEAEHPMLEEHFIQWIFLQTDKGIHQAYLHAGEKPTARFTLGDEKPIAAYEYCNLHGLWKKDICTSCSCS